MGEDNQLSISKYKVDKFEHHVPQSLEQLFKDEVKNAGKRWESMDTYLTSPDDHDDACRKPVVDNKIFHPTNEIEKETIQDVNVQKYEVSRSGDKWIIHCHLDAIDQIINQLKFNDCQYMELDEYTITIQEYQDCYRNPPNNEIFIPIDNTAPDILAHQFAEGAIKSSWR